MKVVFVVGAGDYTGAAKMAHEYAKVARNSGWDIFFIVGDPPSSDCDKLSDFLKKDAFDFVQEKGFTLLRSESLIRRVSKIIKSYKPDFVLSTVQIDLKITGPASRRAGKPVLVFDQTCHYFFGPFFIRYLKKLFFGKEMQKALAIITSGEAVRSQAIKDFFCNPDKVYVVPNGINVQERISINNGSKLPKSGIYGLNVARIDPQKGQQIALESLSVLIKEGLDLKLHCAGTTTLNHPASCRYFDQLNQNIKRHDLHNYFTLLGWRSDVSELLLQYDFYFHCSLWEGPFLPVSLLEAMACGIPVIMTDCAGVPAGFLNGIHGWIVKAGDSNDLAEAMRKMYHKTAEQRIKMGTHCKKLVLERYDIKKTGSLFVSTCERVIQDFSNK